jgi:hypothetical protein
MTNDKDGRKPVQYMTGRLYLVGKRKMKLWSIYRPCRWRSKYVSCKGCPGQLKFKTLKGFHCGYMAGNKPVYRRVSGQKARIKAHKGNTAHIPKGALAEGLPAVRRPK